MSNNSNQPHVDNDYADQFIEWVETEDDMVEFLWPKVHPNMEGRERARKALLIALASQSDKHDLRGRIHVLLWSEVGGTGKSHLRNWAKREIPGAAGAAPGSTEAGLKGNAKGGELSGGALRLAHPGVLALEELEKFGKSDREALFEAMSDGQYEINKGDINRVVPAQIRVIATANDIGKFSKPLLNRFDFCIEMEEYSEEDTIAVSDTIFESMEAAFLDGEAEREPNIIRQYLKWIEPFEPSADEDTIDKMKLMKNHLIRQEGLSGDIRGKEAWFRVPYTIARINRRDLEPRDFIQAVELLHPEVVTEQVRSELEALAVGDYEAAMTGGL